MTLREAATSLAARVPTQVKLLFATLAYYAVICVVFWQVENWPVLDSIYFATGIMSTVGTGDLFPSEDDGLALVHALTIIFAFSGIVLILPVYAFIVSLVFTPLNSWLRRQISKVRPPHKTIAVEGVDGQSTTIPVPTRAFVYYAGELAPAFCLWLAQQFLFSALLCWAGASLQGSAESDFSDISARVAARGHLTWGGRLSSDVGILNLSDWGFRDLEPEQ